MRSPSAALATPVANYTAKTNPVVGERSGVHRRSPLPSIEVECLPEYEQLEVALLWLADGQKPTQSYRRFDDGRVLVEATAGRFSFGPVVCATFAEAISWLTAEALEEADHA